MTAEELLASLTHQGFHLTPLPGGRLEVRPANKLTDDLRRELKRRKAEVLTLLLSTPLPLLCRNCNSEAWPAGGTASKDQTTYIQFWRCGSCGAKGSQGFRLQ